MLCRTAIAAPQSGQVERGIQRLNAVPAGGISGVGWRASSAHCCRHARSIMIGQAMRDDVEEAADDETCQAGKHHGSPIREFRKFHRCDPSKMSPLPPHRDACAVIVGGRMSAP